MKLKIHDDNLQTVWACLNSGHSEVWLHGSGDIFPVYFFDPMDTSKQDHSKNHMENFNKGREECSYRVKINKANMPKSVDEANMMLMRAKALQDNETEMKLQNNGTNRITNVMVANTDYRDDIRQPAGEIDYSQFNKANA